MIRGTEAPLLWRQAEIELLILEKRWLWGDLIEIFPYLKGATLKLERDYLQGHVMTRQGVMTLNGNSISLD